MVAHHDLREVFSTVCHSYREADEVLIEYWQLKIS